MPTMELAIQLRDYLQEFKELFYATDGQTPAEPGRLSIRMLIKDDKRDKDRKWHTKVKPVTQHIVIGTPGTIQKFAKKKLTQFGNVKSFVLDEADHVLAKKMEDQTKQIQQYINTDQNLPKGVPGNYNMLFFSATFTPEVQQLCTDMAPGLHIIKPADYTESKVRKAVRQCKSAVTSDDEKTKRLLEVFPKLATGSGQTLVFVASGKDASRISSELQADDYSVESMNSRGTTSEERQDLMRRFAAGAIKFLITTDVLCRGVNIPAVNFVVHYDLPFVYEDNGQASKQTDNVDLATYLHRSGRCARFTNKGVSLVLYDQQKKTLDAVRQIEAAFCQEMPNQQLEEVAAEGIADLDDLLDD